MNDIRNPENKKSLDVALTENGRRRKVGMHIMKIYMDTVQWFCRPKNTDWQYNFMLGRLVEFEPSLELYYPVNQLHQMRINYDYCRRAIAHRLSRSTGVAKNSALESFADRLCAAELARSRCDVVFSHREFPTNAGNIPVVWHTSILDPIMSLARGLSQELLDRETDLKRKLFARAAKVHCSTETEAARLSAWMPELKDRFVGIPFFLPYLNGIPEAEVVAKHSATGPIQIVFVGREAHRKGLLEILAGLEKIDFGKRPDARITIVSDFRDGAVVLPAWGNLKWHRSLPRNEVVKLLREAHILVMPSRFESYGFVYVEAMAHGVVPLVPDWEVQRELVDNGRCGTIVPVEAQAIGSAVERLMADHEYRSRLAISALRRFHDRYSPRVIARQYVDLFQAAKLNTVH